MTVSLDPVVRRIRRDPVASLRVPAKAPSPTLRHPHRTEVIAPKVAWLTPLGPKSDIGAFSRAILKAAAEDVPGLLDLVPAVNVNGPTYFHAGPMLQLGGGQDEDVLQSFDAVVYNIGNNVENHGHINRLALRHPGIVIVHDLVMQHYVAWEVFERLGDPAVYADLIASHYGERGMQILAASRICARRDGGHRPRYAPWDSPHAIEMPLIEPFIRAATAVVVHSEFAERQVARFCQAPLLRLGLPHDQKPALSEAEIDAWAEATRRRDRVSFAAFGHVGRGKCLPLLIEAFRARPDLAARATLTIAGYPTDSGHAQELADMVRALDLGGTVRLEFAVSMERLQQLKRDADVFVNLRWPNTESASGSLVEQLNTGKPTLIHATGCYAEVPEDAAFRVSPVNSVAALADAMAAAAADPERRIAVGRAGRAHARRIAAQDYVAGLAGFLQQERSLLRARRTVHRRLRAETPRQVVDRSRDGLHDAWAQDLALARDAMAPILDGAPAVSPRAFLWLEPAALRSFIVLGLFGLPEPGANPQLLAWLDRLLASGDRLTVYRAVRQAVALRRLLDGAAADGSPARAIVADPRDLGPVEPAAAGLLACLGADVLAAACYVLVLGRVPGNGEAAGYAARLARGEPVTDVLREMLASPEYAARALPVAESDRLHAAAACAAAAFGPHAVDAPSLEPGRTIVIRDGTSPSPPGLLLGGGGEWHPPEAEGVWSAAPMARLAIRLPEGGAAVAGRRIVLRVRVPLRRRGAPRHLRAFVDEAQVLAVGIDDDGWRDLAVPLPATAGADGVPVRLALELGETVAAADLPGGVRVDPRRLGLMFDGLRLEGPACPVETLQRILLDPASPVDFEERHPCAAMLAKGWHMPEPDGVWSDGAAGEATLRIAAPATAAGGPWVLRLTLGLPVERPGVPRAVTVTLGEEAARTLVRDAEPGETQLELELPLPAPEDDDDPVTYMIGIACRGAFRPADLDGSSDARLLGVRLLRLELQEETSCKVP